MAPDSPDTGGDEDVSALDTITDHDTAVPDTGAEEDTTVDADDADVELPDTDTPDTGQPDVVDRERVPRAIAFSGAGGGVMSGASTRAVVGFGAPTPAPVARGTNTRLILGPAAARP